MLNWKITRYLIDAKKEVDSLWYIAVNHSKINGNIRRLVELRRNTFYINAATVVDKFVGIKTEGMSKKEAKKFKHSLQESNKIIGLLYYYRDKHAAHKDDEFRDGDFSSLMDITRECMFILKEVRHVCSDIFPMDFTLDFVCYDAELFRWIYKIDKDTENKILAEKHQFIMESPFLSNSASKKIFYDTEELWKVVNPRDYCTVLKEGLTFDEGLQNRQDWCIKTNVLHGENLWMTIDEEKRRRCLMMIKLGYLDIFNRQILVNKSLSEYKQDFALIENAGKYLIYDLHIADETIIRAVKNDYKFFKTHIPITQQNIVDILTRP